MGDSCAVCDSQAEWRLVIPNPYLDELPELQIRECVACRLVFVSDAVTPQQLDVVYGRGQDQSAYYTETEHEARAKALRAVADLRALLRSDSRPVLDIGFGHGHFLEAFSEVGGPPVMGQELGYVDSRRWTSRGIHVVSALDEVPDSSCSAAVMLDVAEHVIDPRQTLAEVHRLLEPEGLLYIHTPRRSIFDTLAIQISRRLPRLAFVWLRSRVSIAHLRLWSDEALDIALRRSRFEVIEHRAECELSWPIRRYVRVYLTERIRPGWLKRVVESVVTGVLTVPLRLGLFRNKAIITARKT